MEKIYAESFRDLIVYQKAKAVSRIIFELSKKFPKEETYSLTDQIRRSSRSIGAQIAEAWLPARREGIRRLIKFLTKTGYCSLTTDH